MKINPSNDSADYRAIGLRTSYRIRYGDQQDETEEYSLQLEILLTSLQSTAYDITAPRRRRPVTEKYLIRGLH